MPSVPVQAGGITHRRDYARGSQTIAPASAAAPFHLGSMIDALVGSLQSAQVWSEKPDFAPCRAAQNAGRVNDDRPTPKLIICVSAGGSHCMVELSCANWEPSCSAFSLNPAKRPMVA